MRTINSFSNICYKCKYSHRIKPYLICEKHHRYVECFECCEFYEKVDDLKTKEERLIDAINDKR